MQVWRILTAIALVAAAPMAWASNPEGCESGPREETAANPINDDVYLLVDAQDPGKIGFWEESNGIEGLQTEACHEDGGSLIYEADERSSGILLS